ncbi:MAG: hypothetical protein HYY18_16920 [Planctomycetes bacterium]|nr:hypothetical protein [Planctomycetota bacterium]
MSPAGTGKFASTPVGEGYVMVADPAADGAYLASGPELVRVGPDGSLKILFKLDSGIVRRIAVDAKRGLVHVDESGSKPPKIHTRRLADGGAVAVRELPMPAEGYMFNGLLVHPGTGRVVALLGDGFKGGDNILLFAPAETGPFEPFTVAGAKDAQHAILHPGGDLLFTANDNTADVSLVDLSKNPPVFQHVKTEGKPNGLFYDRKRDTLWVQTWSTKIVGVGVAKKAVTGGFEAFSTGHLYRGVAVDEELGRVVAISGYQGASAALVADLADRALYRILADTPERIALPFDAAPDAVAVDPARGAAWAAAHMPDRLLVFRIRLKDLAVEKIFDGPHPYGAEASKKTWTRCTNTWVPFSRFVIDGKAGKGALVDYLGGRVVLFNLK